jgi:hypothetical protein
MNRKRIVEIEIDKRETFFISQPRFAARPACPLCAAEKMVRPEEAAFLLCVSQREIFRRIEATTIHFEETSDGAIYVCANSLKSEDLNALTVF